MISGAAWLAEGVLEALGFFFFFRRKVTTLWIWMGFRAAADLACFVCRLIDSQAYLWADYIQRNAQYALLAAVCVICSAQILREHPKTRKAYTVALCALALIGIGLLHAVWPPSADRVLLFEVGAELFLAGFIALAMANGRAPRPWGVIAVGLIVLAASDAAVTMLARQDWAWASWYPLGAIPALGIVCWAGWRDYRLAKRLSRLQAQEFRQSVPPKFEPSSVGVIRQISERVN